MVYFFNKNKILRSIYGLMERPTPEIFVGGSLGYAQQGGVGIAEFVSLVDAGDTPRLVRQTQSL